MARYSISLAAQDDMQEIYNYGFERYGEKQADEFHDSLFASFDLIASNPSAFSPVDHIRPGYRRYVHRKGASRTSIYYRLSGEIVEIMRLIGRQNPETI